MPNASCTGTCAPPVLVGVASPSNDLPLDPRVRVCTEELGVRPPACDPGLLFAFAMESAFSGLQLAFAGVPVPAPAANFSVTLGSKKEAPPAAAPAPFGVCAAPPAVLVAGLCPKVRRRPLPPVADGEGEPSGRAADEVVPTNCNYL